MAKWRASEIARETAAPEPSAEERLLATGKFERVEYPNAGEAEAMLKELDLEVDGDVRWQLEALASYLSYPLVVDRFPSEHERNVWQREHYQDPDIALLVENNRLRGNKISEVLGVAELCVSEGVLSKYPEVEAEYREVRSRYTGGEASGNRGYDAMDLEEKVAFTAAVATLAKHLYGALAQGAQESAVS